MRKIAIVGCRPPELTLDLHLPERLVLYGRILADVREFCESFDDRDVDHMSDVVLVSGGAEGVDRYAEEWFGDAIIHRPDYARHGARAPLVRNRLIVRDADVVHAWPAPWSRGTRHTIRLARECGKPCIVHELPQLNVDGSGAAAGPVLP